MTTPTAAACSKRSGYRLWRESACRSGGGSDAHLRGGWVSANPRADRLLRLGGTSRRRVLQCSQPASSAQTSSSTWPFSEASVPPPRKRQVVRR
jgi:hypothetical protein